MRNKHYEIDMLNGALAPKLLAFALPLMVSSIMQLLFNAADVIVVGRYAGDASLAAVTSTGSLVNLLVNLFMGLSIGANVTVAHALGHGDTDRTEKVVHTSVLLSLIGGVFLAIFGALACRTLLELMSSPENVIDLSALYLRIYFMGMPAMLFYNFGSALLRAGGDTQRPMFFLAIAGVVNVVLNLILVIVFHLDVAGVAIATIVSQYISAFLVLRCLMAETGPLHLELKKLRIEKDVLINIVSIGLPAGFQGIVFSISNVVIQSSINSFGDIVMAGSGASANVEGFVYVGMNAFYQTCLTFVGQNYGAAKCDRVDRVVLLCQGFGILSGLILGGLAYLFGNQLLSIYSPNPDIIAQGMIRMFYVGLPYFLCGIMDVMVGALRGLGWSVAPMAVSVLGVCGVRLLWVATIFQTYHTPACLYLSYPISWIITAIIHIICFLFIRKKAYARVTHNAVPA
ncbi:MAG: MATE family efflux transporter [Oscillospiraceae bacterium]|jgi:putative MATE family efflux protein|nr:MATE family efflux transporter [Oscillospiraceae bacterium]